MTQRPCSLTQRPSLPIGVVSPISEAFDDIFRELRLKAVVYYAHDFCSPWGLRFEATENAQVHVVLHGSCQVVIGDRTVHLGEQDVLLLPAGTAHIISDDAEHPARDAREVYRELCNRREPLPGARPSACLLSGRFAFDRMAKELLLPHLPDVLHMSAREDRDPRVWSVLVQTIRDRLPGDKPQRNLFSGALDPRLSAPIAMIHACYHDAYARGDRSTHRYIALVACGKV
jgi:Cupin